MKETKKQIKAQLVNEVRREYAAKLQALRETKNNAFDRAIEAEHELSVLRQKVSRLEEQNAELTQKVEQYEEWIERMQDFCNLPEGERESAFKTYMDGIKAKAELGNTIGMINNFFRLSAKMF